MFSRFFIVAWTFLLCVLPFPAEAGGKRHVLVLHSYSKGLSWTDKITRGIEQILVDQIHEHGLRLQVDHEFMDTKRFSGEQYYQLLYSIYEHKYRHHNYDLIISADDNALNFLVEYRNDLFGEVPVVFCGVNNFAATEPTLQGWQHYTGIVEAFDVRSNLNLIQKLHPDTREILVVSDQSGAGIANTSVVEQISPEYETDKLRFRYLDDGDFEAYRSQLSSLPHGTVALILPITHDKQKRAYTYEESFERFGREISAPSYSPWDFYLGMGIVGGMMISGEEQGIAAARMALRILKGEAPERIAVNRNSPNVYKFDYRQMVRFGIPESALPSGAKVINKDSLLRELYERHTALIWTVILFIVSLIVILILLTINIFRRIHAEKEQQRIHRQLLKTNQAYSRFVPHHFLQFLGHDSILDVGLGDQTQEEFSVLFSDIRSFTNLSEKMTPMETFLFINEYLKRMGPIVRENNGFIDKYIGDAIMALFAQSPADAVRAAVEMQKVVGEYNQERQLEARRFREPVEPICIGIGIHTGTLMLGMIGESERMEGTVLSDAVNLASRIEGLTKMFDAGIAVSGSTLRNALGGMAENEIHHRFLGAIRVKGKTRPVKIFEVFDGDADDLKTHKQQTLEIYNKALDCYFARDFTTARNYFSDILQSNPMDKASLFYHTRCEELSQTDQLDPQWDGVISLSSK